MLEHAGREVHGRVGQQHGERWRWLNVGSVRRSENRNPSRNITTE